MTLSSLFSFDTWFPFFDGIVQNIHQMATMTAFVILVSILVFEIKGDVETILGAIFKVAVLAGLISIDQYSLGLINNVSYGVANSILASPFQATANAFINQMSGGSVTGGSGPLSWLFLASNSFTMAIVGAVCFLAGLIVLPILWLIYLFQQGIGGMAYAFLPIFIALMGTKRFSSMGSNYLVSVIALNLWPIGIAIVLVGTVNLLSAQGPFGGTQSIPLLNSSPEALKVLFAAGYTIVGIIAAPIVTQKAVTAGGNFGTAALGTMFGIGQAAATAGAGAIASSGASAAGAVAASAQQAHNAAVLGKLGEIAAGVSGGSGSSSSGAVPTFSRGGFGSPSTSSQSNSQNGSSGGSPWNSSSAGGTGSGSVSGTGGGSSSSSGGGSASGSTPSLTPQAAVAAARASGGGGGSSAPSPLPAGWAPSSAGSVISAPPSYHEARKQAGSGDAAVRMLMAQTAFAKPVMS